MTESASTTTTTTTTTTTSLLTEEHIAHFKEHGYCVIHDVASASEVAALRRQLHRQVRATAGVDYERMDNSTARKLRESGSFSQGHLNVFYAPWKLDAMFNDTVMAIVSDLWRATFASGTEHGYRHDFGAFDPSHAFAYCDRACFRLPDHLKASGGLKLHIDMSLKPSDDSKWRPIQMSLALTDHVSAESGGIGFAPGWHRKIVKRCRQMPDKGRTFYPLSEADFPDVHADKVICDNHLAGSLCIWDNRLPHFVSDRLAGDDTREVLFASFLPDVAANQAYVQQQLTRFMSNKCPPDFGSFDVDRDARAQLSALQRRLFGIDQWESTTTSTSTLDDDDNATDDNDNDA